MNEITININDLNADELRALSEIVYNHGNDLETQKKLQKRIAYVEEW